MAEKKENVKTFEYEEEIIPEAEEVEMGEAVEVEETPEVKEEEADDNINLDWGVLYTFNMYN